MVNIPIYRAKKIDSDEWVEGLYYQVPPIDKDIIGHMIGDFLNTMSPTQIDPSTVAIHFPNMEKDMFASFDCMGGIGGSVVEFDYLFSLDKTLKLKGVAVFNDTEQRLEFLMLENEYGFEVLSFNYVLMSNFKVIGIHKG